MLTKHFKISANTHVQDTLNHIQFLCDKSALSLVKQNTVLIICAELINNIIKYAHRGEVSVIINKAHVQIKAKDIGNGLSIPIEEAFIESRSASGSLGLGLSSIVRLSDDLSFCTSKSGVVVNCMVNTDV